MKRVVLVEDEEIIRRGLKTILEEIIGGFSVVAEAGNGRNLLALIEREQPDLVITDIRMPGVDGLEVVRSLAARLPVIILSGYAEFEYAREAMKHGVRSYLLKPVDRIELAKVLESIFPKEGNPVPDTDAEESSQIVRDVKRLVAENLASELSLQGLADRIRINSQYLSRVFKDQTGENLSRYIARLRVEKARHLLETTHLKVYEIAELCGFGNEKRFLAVFKEISGKTPSSFRNG